MNFEAAFFGIEALLNRMFCEEWDSKLHCDVGVSREIPLYSFQNAIRYTRLMNTLQIQVSMSLSSVDRF